VDESHAWLQQALADREAAEREQAAAKAASNKVWCHAVAKYQQAVEKAAKAMVAGLAKAKIINARIGYKHEVEKWVKVLVRLPARPGSTSIQRHLNRLFDSATRNELRSLESLIPKASPDGRPRRNTEYPFHDAAGNWTYPAARAVFSVDEIERFRALSYRIADVASRILATLRRDPS
jgi:hypothetical protein